MKKIRADVFLVQEGHFASRAKAQDAIRQGIVSVKTDSKVHVLEAVSEMLDFTHPFQIIIDKSGKDAFVSRAGSKLAGALKYLNLTVKGLVILDVGISTGGFTDCLLQNGAAQIVGIDVGHGQLDLKIRSDPRVTALEGINARELLLNADFMKVAPANGFELIVIDVSFISLVLVLPQLPRLLSPGGRILALVKPQFEVGIDGLGKNGIVKDEKLYGQVRQKIEECARRLDLVCNEYFSSAIEGRDGNKEFFGYFKKVESV